MQRISWDEYFMNLAEFVKTRSTCMRRQVGAVIVKDNRVITTGYNGAPAGLAHCTEIGFCERERLNIPSGQRHELCRALHAEQSAIIQAAKIGVPIDGATVYITLRPCVICAKMLINSGVKRIVYKGDYPDVLSLNILNEAGIEMVRMEEQITGTKTDETAHMERWEYKGDSGMNRVYSCSGCGKMSIESRLTKFCGDCGGSDDIGSAI